MEICKCCGRRSQHLNKVSGGGYMHFDCWEMHHSDPTGPWPPGHVCKLEKEKVVPEETNPTIPCCAECGRTPDEISEYSREMTGEPVDPIPYVMRNEGTYSAVNNTFWCTECYIKIGMPLGTAGPRP